MEDSDAIILGIIILIFSFIAGIFLGLNSVDKDIEDKLCKQLYTNTANYLNCKNDNDIYKYIERVKPIEE